MDIIRFLSPTKPTLLEQGQIVNNIKSVMWVERYQEPGEFEIRGYVDSGLREALPLNSVITHMDTKDAMLVENHQIKTQRGRPSEIVITGRALDGFTDFRMTTSHIRTVRGYQAHKGSAYGGFSGDYHDVILSLLKSFTWPSSIVDSREPQLWLDNIYLRAAIRNTIPQGAYYRILPQPVSKALLENLQAADYGVKIVRPGPWTTALADPGDMEWFVHDGLDKTLTAIFSYDAGDIDSAEYLWSTKSQLDGAWLIGTRLEQIVFDPTKQGLNFRLGLYENREVDAEIDFATAPASAYDAAELDLLDQGQKYVDAHVQTQLVSIDSAKMSERIRYRTDYNIGDLVTIEAEYGIVAYARVTEHVETQDEKGFASYPVFRLL